MAKPIARKASRMQLTVQVPENFIQGSPPIHGQLRLEYSLPIPHPELFASRVADLIHELYPNAQVKVDALR